MEHKILILIGMIFCHIVDDYYLQGWLASAKQKEYWSKNAPDPMYKYDYIVALIMHSFSWTCSISFLPLIYNVIFGGEHHLRLFVLNILLHAIIDDGKANRKRLNLVQDQCLHLIQIVLTWVTYMF